MSPEEYKDDIRFAITLIDNELDAAEPLFKIAKVHSLDYIQILAAAAIIHSVYTGIESILQMLHKITWGRLPDTRDWHSKLLDMFSSDNLEAPIHVHFELLETLKDLMGFRHRFRHGYGYKLDHSIVTQKLLLTESAWKSVRALLDAYLEQD